MLRYKADIRTILFVLAYFVLVVASLTLTLPVWGTVALTVVLSMLSFFCAVITHNVVHTPVFKSRALNRVFQLVLTVTYGHPVSMFVPGHNLSHHKYLQTTKDRMRTDKMRFRWNLLNQLLFNFAVGPAIFKDNATYVKQMTTRRPRWVRQFWLEMAAYGLFLIGTLSAAVLLGEWWKFLVFIVIPHQYAVWGIAGINFVQHDGCEAGHPYNHSRNFTGKLVNWFTFNNGYHGIHHEHPGLHWSLAPEAHNREYSPHIHPALEQKSLLAYCFKAYIFPGRRVNFDGTKLVLGPPRKDEAWIPGALNEGLGDANNDLEYGAIS